MCGIISRILAEYSGIHVVVCRVTSEQLLIKSTTTVCMSATILTTARPVPSPGDGIRQTVNVHMPAAKLIHVLLLLCYGHIHCTTLS